MDFNDQTLLLNSYSVVFSLVNSPLSLLYYVPLRLLSPRQLLLPSLLPVLLVDYSTATTAAVSAAAPAAATAVIIV